MSEEKSINDNFLINQNPIGKTKIYKRRWIILFLYILYAAINAFQWFEYAIIANIIRKYYNISALAVDWTSIIYMALYMPMVIPASYLMNKKGLRVTALIGVSGTALGTIIKIFSINPNRIWLIYLAQTILSSMQVFILALPPHIAATWFGPKQVSLACSLGVFGTLFGQAIGLFLPPILVKNHDNIYEIGNDLSRLVNGLAGIAAVVLLSVIIYFPAKPPLPPNPSQLDSNRRNESPEFIKSLKNLIYDKGFVYHSIAYGINIAVFVSISTLLNQFLLAYYEKSEEDAGRIGLIMIILGMLGSVIFGYILDRTHRYKETTFSIYFLSTIAVALFMFALESGSILFVYLSGALVGFSINTYMLLGLELAIELTFPEPESTSSGILISMTQTLGALFTLLLGWLFNQFGCFWALACMDLFLILGSILTAIIPNVLKRQEMFKNCKSSEHFIEFQVVK